MHDLIDDFVKSGKTYNCNGVGYFKDDTNAVNIARKMGKVQERKFTRYNIVPRAFFFYLKIKNILRKDTPVKKDYNADDLSDFLWYYPYQTQEARDAGGHIREQLLKARYPELLKAFGEADQVWMHLQIMKNLGTKAAA